MSLLGGIRYIPKEKREIETKVKQTKSESSDTEKSEDSEAEVRHKHKKHKKEKKHSKHSHKEHKHSKKEKSKYAVSDHSSDSEFDMAKIVREEEERERSEWKTLKDRHNDSGNRKEDREHHIHGNRDTRSKDNGSHRHEEKNHHSHKGNDDSFTSKSTKQQLDPDRFKTLLNSLLTSNSATPDQSSSTSTIQNISSLKVIDKQNANFSATDYTKYAKDNWNSDSGDDDNRYDNNDNDDNDDRGDDTNRKERSRYYNDEHDSNYATNKATNNTATKPPVVVKQDVKEAIPCKTSNQSAASMLRDRLKAGKGVIKSDEMLEREHESGGGKSSNNLFDYYNSNAGNQKQLVALQSQLNARQKDSATTVKTLPPHKHRNKKDTSTNNTTESIGTTSTSTGSQQDIKALMLKEKRRANGIYADEDDMDAVFAQNVLRMGEKYQGNELGGKGAFGNGDRAGQDEEGEIDMKMFQRQGDNAANSEANLKKQVARVMLDKKRLNQAVSHCACCQIQAKTHRDHGYVLSRGEYAMLCLKPTHNTSTTPHVNNSALIEHHLEITPLEHIASINQCDEETIKEIDRYKQCIAHMFNKEYNSNVLFTETAIRFDRLPHAVVDCFAIERGVESEAKMFFKEAFLACDVEWSQYRKIIELTKERPLRRAVPTHFQYLAVEWIVNNDNNGEEDTYEGLAHAVESAEDIKPTFCTDVVAGILDVEVVKMRQVSTGVKAEEENKRNLSMFGDAWSQYDWTQYM